MRILLATGIFPPSIGGPATYTKLLSTELPKRGIEAEVVTFDAVRHLPKLIRHFSYFLRVFKAAKQTDVVYAQDPVSVGLPALCAARLCKKRFMLKVVGDYAWEQGTQRYGVTDRLDVFATKNKAYRMPVRLMKRIQLFVAKSAERVIVPSVYLKSIVVAWGVPADKVHVIYNAFDAPALPSESRDDIRRKEFIDGRLIVSVGRLVPWKGFDTLIELAGRLQREFPDVGLLIIGDGPERTRLEAKAKALGLGRAVRFAGKLPQDKMLRLLSAADLFVLNTSYEGFSHQLLEVMALGVPIVTTAVGGNPELIQDGVEGILLPYDDREAFRDTMARIFEGTIPVSRYALKAKEKVATFTVDRMVTELVKHLYA